MDSIDFTPTTYTVKSPGNGKTRRYEGEYWEQAITDAKVELAQLINEYPNLARFVVPDHFVQEYCRDYDSNLYGGGRGFGVSGKGAFFRLAEKGLGAARFS